MADTKLQVQDEERLNNIIVSLSDANKDKHVRALRYHAQETLDFLNLIRPNVKEIPNFWRTALLNHTLIAQQASLSADVDALGYLSEIELKQDPQDPRPFELIFHFAENPYFSNSTLSKSYTLPKGIEAAPSDGEITDDLRLFEPDQLVSSAMKIDWKEGKNLCDKHPRAVVGDEDEFDGDPGSFFWFFTNESDPFVLGHSIVQDVLTDPVMYYENEGDNCEGDEYDSEDEEDEEDEDEIDLEDEDDEPPKKKTRTNGE